MSLSMRYICKAFRLSMQSVGTRPVCTNSTEFMKLEPLTYLDLQWPGHNAA